MSTTALEPKTDERPSPEIADFGGGGWRNWSPNGGRLRATQNELPPPGSSAIWVAIAAITMMFAAFTSALFVREGTGMDWQHIALPNVLFLNTALLLASSVTLEISRHRFAVSSDLSPRESRESALWLWATLALGVVFVVGQYVAWRQLRAEGLYLASNPSSSFFYVLTATHALHVLLGLGGLVYVIMKARRLVLRQHTLNVAATYWHFMDLLWLYLLGLLWMKL